MLSIKAPILPVVRIARGGSRKQRKYLMATNNLIVIYLLDHQQCILLLFNFFAQVRWQLIAIKQRFQFGSIVRVHFTAQY